MHEADATPSKADVMREPPWLCLLRAAGLAHLDGCSALMELDFENVVQGGACSKVTGCLERSVISK